MGAGPVNNAAAPVGSWRLNDANAPLTQGLVVSPYDHLPEAEALLFELPATPPGQSASKWLRELTTAIPITDATGRRPDVAAAIAFTCSGLVTMGLDGECLASFSTPFLEGMQQSDRQRRLGDVPTQNEAVIDGGPQWGGGGVQDTAPSLSTVHAMLLLYGVDAGTLQQKSTVVRGILAVHGITLRRDLRLSLRKDAQGIAREHFGFADGISQPIPYGPEVVDANNQPYPPNPVHQVKLGEILMGFPDAHDAISAGPRLRTALANNVNLPASAYAPNLSDLGINGSYLVVRELRQDVARFWNSMATAAKNLGLSPKSLAERIVGRSLDGVSLTPDNGGGNDFRYFAKDQYGFGCPLGSHVRRANPRDGLAKDATMVDDLLQSANSHRILRRGRKFGTDLQDHNEDDGKQRGLLFMCLNTDIARQFEFVQQNWLLNRSFATLYDETDPLLGPKGQCTLPRQPLRQRAPVETYIQFAGGEYFFLPGMRALEYLCTL